jgi:hypothetical protein
MSCQSVRSTQTPTVRPPLHPIDAVDRATRQLRLVETLLLYQADICLNADSIADVSGLVSDACDRLETVVEQMLAAEAAARAGGAK